MKYPIATLLLVTIFCALAGKPPKSTGTIPSGWNEEVFGGYYWGQNGPTIAFRQYNIGQNGNYSTAFFVTNYTASLTTNATMTLQLTVTGNNIGWMYGGQFSFNVPTNSMARPANVRLYFSRSNQKYNNNGPEDDYWFCNAPGSFAWMPTDTSTLTLVGRLEPSQWTNGQGGKGSDRLAAFLAAASNMKVAGAAFGGNRYYDTGAAYTNATSATVTLTVNNFYVQ